MLKRTTAFLAAVSLSLSLFATSSASAAEEKIDYLVLGDSIAAGQLYNGTFGAGYAGLIRTEIEEQGKLGSFTKQYAASGQTSGQLLEKLQQADVQQSIKDAELITVSTGANDFIQLVKQGGSVSSSEGLALLRTVTANVTAAVQQMKKLNTTADIYVFGYYFPLPYYEGADKNTLKLAFSMFNGNLKSTAETNGAHFVEVASMFDPKAFDYLPNPNDIHPNEAGYQVFADQFFTSYDLNGDDIPAEPPFPDLNGLWGKLMEKGTVEANKPWAIRLSKAVDPDSLPGAIYVVKDGTSSISVQPSISADGKSISIPAPSSGYAAGSYSLLITDGLKDENGKPLKTTVKMTFNVK